MTEAASSTATTGATRALSVVVLISGTGSNLKAIARAVDQRHCAVRIAAVISDKSSAKGLAWASERGLATRVVSPRDFAGRPAWDAALTNAVASFEPDLVVLAGFMRIVGQSMLDRFPRKIVNVHPSLLPAFPGIDAPAQALAAGVRISGCTVHLVDRGVDTGPIIAQAAIPVLPDDDTDALHARIQRSEHMLLPAVLDAVARGRIQLSPSVNYLRELVLATEEAQLTSPAIVDSAPALHSPNAVPGFTP